MIDEMQPLDGLVESLLADPRYTDHPLHEVLRRLWAQDGERLQRLERIAAISDGYQKMVIENTRSMAERYDHHLRRLEKMVRISDGYQKMLRDLYSRVEELSTLDHLTGLPNRRLILGRLDEESRHAVTDRPSYVVALLDIDHFKHVNDRFGHDAGDTVLVAVAQAMQGALRDYDVCARWGGEEFLLLLPKTTSADGSVIMDRLRQRVRALAVDVRGESLSITASVGLTDHRVGEPISATIARADAALMEAKRRGRDCCIVR